jgi:hypothetical protein
MAAGPVPADGTIAAAEVAAHRTCGSTPAFAYSSPPAAAERARLLASTSIGAKTLFTAPAATAATEEGRSGSAGAAAPTDRMARLVAAAAVAVVRPPEEAAVWAAVAAAAVEA